MRFIVAFLSLPACGLSEFRLLESRSDGGPGFAETTEGIPDLLDTGTEPTEPGPPLIPDLAGDVQITKVSLYQGVERALWVDGAPADPSPDVPVVAERDALLRVFVEPGPGFEPRDLVVSVSLTSPHTKNPIELGERMRVERASTDADLSSTFTIEVSADDLLLGTELLVELREASISVVGEGVEETSTFDSLRDLPEGLPLEQGEDMRLVIIPFRYTADGSDRVPDTSDAAMAAMVDLLEAMYPVRSVALEVADAWEWKAAITRNGTGFTEALVAVSNARDAADEPANTYYYGLFDPASSFQAFCGQSCVVGLSNLASSTRYPGLRASVGIGYTAYDIAADTLAHEVGHAHGREHAPCGGPAGIDPDYPHGNAELGAWGYDRRTGTLLAPGEHVDIMSYCDPTWISDYNFAALFDRNTALSTSLRSAPRLVTRLVIGAEGQVLDQRWVTELAGSAGGALVAVETFDAGGLSRGYRNAWWAPFSHVPGGMVMLEEALPEAWTAVLRP